MGWSRGRTIKDSHSDALYGMVSHCHFLAICSLSILYLLIQVHLICKKGFLGLLVWENSFFLFYIFSLFQLFRSLCWKQQKQFFYHFHFCFCHFCLNFRKQETKSVIIKYFFQTEQPLKSGGCSSFLFLDKSTGSHCFRSICS